MTYVWHSIAYEISHHSSSIKSFIFKIMETGTMHHRHHLVNFYTSCSTHIWTQYKRCHRRLKNQQHIHAQLLNWPCKWKKNFTEGRNTFHRNFWRYSWCTARIMFWTKQHTRRHLAKWKANDNSESRADTMMEQEHLLRNVYIHKCERNGRNIQKICCTTYGHHSFQNSISNRQVSFQLLNWQKIKTWWEFCRKMEEWQSAIIIWEVFHYLSFCMLHWYYTSNCTTVWCEEI
jgi:hypothetical protein